MVGHIVRKKRRTLWSPERAEELRARWAAGETASAIAAKLGDGVTRMSVLGKIHRMGLNAPQGRAPQGRDRPTTPVVRMNQTDERKRPPGPDPEIFIEARVHMRDPCRWPIGDPRKPGFHFCGARRSSGSYCAEHAARSVTPTPKLDEE